MKIFLDNGLFTIYIDVIYQIPPTSRIRMFKKLPPPKVSPPFNTQTFAYHIEEKITKTLHEFDHYLESSAQLTEGEAKVLASLVKSLVELRNLEIDLETARRKQGESHDIHHQPNDI